MEHFETLWNISKEGQRMQEMEQEQNKTEVQEQEQQVLSPDAIYKNNIYALVDDVKQEPQFLNKTDEELKKDKSFFPILIDYIYNTYICKLLNNNKKTGNNYSLEIIDTIDDLFNIYTQLVYKYKWNNKPFIVEFSTFVGISKDTFYRWLNNDSNNNYIGDAESEKLTSHRSDIVRKWVDICERELLNGSDTIRDIFILKAKYNYRDNNNDINITVNHKNLISADDLPALIDIKNG